MSARRPSTRETAISSRNSTRSQLAPAPRRTPAQIAQAKATAAQEESQARSKVRSAIAAKSKKIAVHEDHLRLEDLEAEKNAARPDLATQKVMQASKVDKARPKPVPIQNKKDQPRFTYRQASAAPDVLHDNNSDVEEPNGIDDDPVLDHISLPEDSEVSSSSSRGNSAIPEETYSDSGSEYEEKELEEGDVTDGSENVVPSDVDDKPGRRQPRSKVRGLLRQEHILSHRETTAVNGAQTDPSLIKKRKNLDDTASAEPGKRSKQVGPPTGLLGGFKKKLVAEKRRDISDRNARNKSVEQGDEEDPEMELDPLEYAGGIFDQDEQAAELRAARQDKVAQVSVRKTGTTTVKIFQPSATVPLERSVRGRKPKYNVSCLPFPGGSENVAFQRLWRKKFKPSLIRWAATQSDPFGTNAVMDPIVDGLWRELYPSLAGAIAGHQRGVVIQIAGDALIDWRSSMGKEGISVVRKMFRDEGITQDEAADAAQHCLDGYRFIYRDPDAEKDQKGGFMGPLVLQVFAFHLKKTMHFVELKDRDYHDEMAIGALGMSAAVVERALEHIKSGDVLISKDDDENAPRKREKKTAFADNNWGDKTRIWVGTAQRLREDQWEKIVNSAVEILSNLYGMDESDGDEPGQADPRTLIEL